MVPPVTTALGGGGVYVKPLSMTTPLKFLPTSVQLEELVAVIVDVEMSPAARPDVGLILNERVAGAENGEIVLVAVAVVPGLLPTQLSV